jgi:hypothetical protein
VFDKVNVSDDDVGPQGVRLSRSPGGYTLVEQGVMRGCGDVDERMW